MPVSFWVMGKWEMELGFFFVKRNSLKLPQQYEKLRWNFSNGGQIGFYLVLSKFTYVFSTLVDFFFSDPFNLN